MFRGHHLSHLQFEFKIDQRAFGRAPARGSSRERLGQTRDEFPNLNPHPAVMNQGVFLGGCVFGQLRRVVETDMDFFGPSRKKRAGFVGMPAEGSHNIKFSQRQLIDCLGRVMGYIHTGLGHHPDRQRVEAVFFDAGRISLDLVRLQKSCPALGHLAAAGIARANKILILFFML
jgi:hypothetical protein